MKKTASILPWIFIVIPLAYLGLTWNGIPTEVPIHYNLQGEADRIGSKDELLLALLIMTVVNVLVYLLLKNIHRIDPKTKTSARPVNLSRLATGICFFVSALQVIIIYTSSHPGFKFQSHFVLVLVGGLIAFSGNYMYTIRPNYFAGIRLPWTLEDPENWKKTHILAGKLWFAGGLLIAILAFILSNEAALIAMMCILAIIVIIPCLYSFSLYKRFKNLHPNE